MTRLLVTRPEPDAGETAGRLRALDIEPVVCPLLTFRTLPTGLPEAQGFAGVALSSANALRALAERDALAPWLDLPAYCVGDRTARAARHAGFADVRSADGSFDDLVRLLGGAAAAGPVFYPAARVQAGDLSRALAPRGIMVVTARVYDMVAATGLPDPVLTDLQAGRIDGATFYSKRTAEAFLACLAGSPATPPMRRRLGMLCLSEAVARPLMAAGFARVMLADYPSEEAMLGLCLSFAREQNAP